MKGLDATSGQLFFEIPRILAARQPAAFLLENVPNLLEHDGGATMARLKEELEACGYEVHERVLQATPWVPQQRRRLYLVGFRNGLQLATDFEWPDDTPGTAAPTLASVLEPLTEEQTLAHSLSPEQWAKIKEHQISRETPLAKRLARPDGVARTLISSYRKAFLLYSEFLQVDGKEEPRFFTAREAARIQGFPESYVLDTNGAAQFERIYHQLGNAVSPPVIETVARAIAATGIFDAKPPPQPTVPMMIQGMAVQQHQVAFAQQHAVQQATLAQQQAVQQQENIQIQPGVTLAQQQAVQQQAVQQQAVQAFAAQQNILIQPGSAAANSMIPTNPVGQDGKPIPEPADQLLPAGRHGASSGYKGVYPMGGKKKQGLWGIDNDPQLAFSHPLIAARARRDKGLGLPVRADPAFVEPA